MRSISSGWPVVGLPEAVFSNLTQDHLDYHHSMEVYFEAKAACLSLRCWRGGPRAVVNVDDPWGQRLAERLGERPGAVRWWMHRPICRSAMWR